MAVARIKATPEWFAAAADSLPDSEKRAARELRRAIDRPGRLAELARDEVEALNASLPGDPLVVEALAAVEAALASEGRRRRGVYRYGD